jgi:hypothetical protein
MLLGLTGITFGQTFGPGDGDNYGTSTSSGHGGSATPYTFTSNIFADVDPDLKVGKIDSITIHDLETTNAQGLQFFMTDGIHFVRVFGASLSEANFNGDYTFVDDPSLQKISEVAAGLGSNDLVPSGTYRIEAGFIGFGDSGDDETFDHFIGTSIRPGWNLTLLNFSGTNTGSFDGWTVTVTPQAVPEPATFAVLGIGAAALARRRRK